MTPERWQQASRIYEAALEREADARAAFLADACGEDQELRREVESLLAHETAPILLDSPVWDLADDLLDADAGFAIGARVGGYQIEAVLGTGGMGRVYRARDLKLNRDVALKALPEVFTDDPERLARFTREAHVLASLNHPGIAAIYGLEDTGGVHALVLELVEGATLEDRHAHAARFRSTRRFRSLSRSLRRWRRRMSKGSSIAISSQRTSRFVTTAP